MIYGILGLLMIVAPIIFIIYAVKSYKLHKAGDKIRGAEYSINITDVKSNGESITLHYDYTNESDEDQTHIYKLSIHFFQNGIELDTDYSRDNYKDQDTILGGYTNTGLEEKVKLNDDSDTVLIKVKPWVDFSNTALYSLI